MDFSIGEGGSRKAVKRSHRVLQNDLQPNKLLPIHGIKEEVADELVDEKRRKCNLSTDRKLKFEPKAANLLRTDVPNVGRKQVCDFFESDGSDDSNTDVLETCMTRLKKCKDDPLVVCTMYAGALAAYYPRIRQKVKDTLIGLGADLNIIYLPAQANENGIDLEENDAYDVCDVHVIMGACVCVLFTNIRVIMSYPQFIRNHLRELARMLGMSKSKIAELTQPLTIDQAKYICEKLGLDNNLKKELLVYVKELMDKGGYVEVASRYISTIASSNER